VSENARATVLFWATLGIGFLLPAVVAVGVDANRGMPILTAIQLWIANLFLPGYNEFLLSLIEAAPYAGLAIFGLFHLTSEGTNDPMVHRARLTGFAAALLAAAALSTWMLIAIRSSRSSTAALGYLALPFYVVPVMCIGYATGRWIAKARRTDSG
jgi:hypothetical protein